MKYDYSELTDMVMCYGEARGNGHEARRIYVQRHPNRRHPRHTTFASVVRRLQETGSLHYGYVGGGRRAARTPHVDEAVVEMFISNPSTST